MKWSNRGGKTNPYAVMKTAIGKFWVMDYADGWLATLDPFEADADLHVGKFRRTMEESKRDAERFLHRLTCRLVGQVRMSDRV